MPDGTGTKPPTPGSLCVQAVMRPHEAADYMRLSPATLARMRRDGDGPRYIRVSKRIVLYARAELDGWLGERGANSLAEEWARRHGRQNADGEAGE